MNEDAAGAGVGRGAAKQAREAWWKCRYCATSQVWSGACPETCAHCGAEETDFATLAQMGPRPQSTRRVKAAALVGCAVLVVVASAIFLWLHFEKAVPRVAPIVDGRAEPAGSGGMAADVGQGGDKAAAADTGMDPAVGDTRIVTVNNPHIRVIPKGVDFEPEDLIRTGTAASPASFDTRQFRIVPPRRLRDEEGNAVWLGEVINTGSKQAAISPTISVTLVRIGQQLQHAEHVFPDIPPGERVPLFITFGNSPPVFDSMLFAWKAVQAYSYGDEAHPQLKATVATRRESRQFDDIGDKSFTWNVVTGTIVNQGSAPARKFDVYVVLRDSAGDLTGFKHDTRTETIAPGGKVNFDNGAAQWDRPAATVEVYALPTSPPLF